MLSVLLTILKVIGIVLAVLLGLIVVLLLLVLFVPVKYDLLVKFYDNKPYAKVNVSALFKLVRFRLEFQEKLVYWAKVLIFKVLSSEKADKPEKESKKADKKKTKKDKKSEESTVFDEMEDKEGVPKEGKSDAQPQETSNESKTDDVSLTEGFVELQRKSLGEKITDTLERIKTFFTNIKNKIVSTWESVVQKKEDATKKVNEVIAMVNDEGNREFVRFLWEQLKYLLRKIKPVKGHLYVHFGMDDPETTGKIAMYLAVLYGLMGIEINIQPDFEQKVMEGELFLKGKLRLITVVVIGLRILFNKHFKRIVLKK